MQDSTEVTGSMTLCVVKIDDKTIKFAVDCGIYQERNHEEQNERFIVKPDEVDFVILTHNHVDHNGRLPYLFKQGFRGKIYMTNITQSILSRALLDNAKVIKDNSKRKNKEPLYTAEDVEQMLPYGEGVDYNKPVRLNENITITFVPNGHLIGAASVLVQIHASGEEKDINLFFSGDYNNKNMFYRVAPIRKWITKLPLNIMIESTYGKMDSCEIKEVFRKNIVKALRKRKTIIIPVFSLGRAQEILFILKDMQKKYPARFKDVRIYYVGKLSFYYTDKYKELQELGILHFYQEKKDFLPDNLIKILDKNIRKEIIADNSCKVILTTSGMGSYGPAQTYIPAFISNPNCLIHFTGYCSEGTLGSQLKNTPKGEIVEVGGARTEKWADVEFTTEFSAHAKADELIKLLNKFEKPSFVMVNHGEDSTKEAFSNRILKEVENVKTVGILGREYFYRIDKNGFVKGGSSKLLI
jgi:metallo-beta-lactamase family protein